MQLKKHWLVLLLFFVITVSLSLGVFVGFDYSEQQDCEFLLGDGEVLYDVERYRGELSVSEFNQLLKESEENYKEYIENFKRECLQRRAGSD